MLIITNRRMMISYKRTFRSALLSSQSLQVYIGPLSKYKIFQLCSWSLGTHRRTCGSRCGVCVESVSLSFGSPSRNENDPGRGSGKRPKTMMPRKRIGGGGSVAIRRLSVRQEDCSLACFDIPCCLVQWRARWYAEDHQVVGKPSSCRACF